MNASRKKHLETPDTGHCLPVNSGPWGTIALQAWSWNQRWGTKKFLDPNAFEILKFPTGWSAEAAAEAFEDAPFGAQGGRGNIRRSKIFYPHTPCSTPTGCSSTKCWRNCEDNAWQGRILASVLPSIGKELYCLDAWVVFISSWGGCLGISWWIRLEVWHITCWFKVMIDPKVLTTASYSLLYHGSWGS